MASPWRGAVARRPTAVTARLVFHGRVGLCATAVAAGCRRISCALAACVRAADGQCLEPRASSWLPERGIFLFTRWDPRGEKRLSRPHQGHLLLKAVSTLLAAAVRVLACLEVRNG
ncbi:hypothetical protein MTO96_019155 [Rhipicephalus appendiculatus]